MQNLANNEAIHFSISSSKLFSPQVYKATIIFFLYISVQVHILIWHKVRARGPQVTVARVLLPAILRSGPGCKDDTGIMRLRRRQIALASAKMGCGFGYALGCKVARWQNLIPSFPRIVPGWRAWGRNPRKGRDQIFQRSVAEP